MDLSNIELCIVWEYPRQPDGSPGAARVPSAETMSLLVAQVWIQHVAPFDSFVPLSLFFLLSDSLNLIRLSYLNKGQQPKIK